MAASSSGFRFEIPLFMETDDGQQILSERLDGVFRHLTSEISLLNKYLLRKEKLSCIWILEITLQSGRIVCHFCVESLDELNEFYSVSSRETLSSVFTNYAEEKCLQILAGFGISTKLRCCIQMDDILYRQGVIFFTGTGDRKAAGANEERDKGSQTKPAQANSQQNDSQHTEENEPRTLKKEVILALPELKSNQAVDSVSLKIRDSNISDREEVFEMSKCKQFGLMVVNVDIPVNSQMDKIQYEFEIHITEQNRVFPNSNKTLTSDLYQMRTTNVLRHFWNPKKTPIPLTQFINHCNHMISENYCVCDSAMQIESFCSGNNFSRESAQYVYTKLWSVANKNCKKQMLLSLILFGTLFRNYLYIARTSLQIDAAQKLLDSLKHFKLTELPQSCSSYLFKLANDICIVALQKKYCLLAFIDAVYPFFEEKHISEKLIEKVRDKMPLVPKEKTPYIKRCLINLFDNIRLRLNHDGAKMLLEQLLRNLPLVYSEEVYAYIKNKQATSDVVLEDCLKIVFDVIVASIKCRLNSVKNLNELSEIHNVIDGHAELTVSVQDELEKAVIRCSSETNDKHLDLLKDIVFKENIFSSIEQQIALIEILSKNKKTVFHLLLFEILSTTKFRETALKVECQLVECFENASSYFKRGATEEKTMKDMYHYMSNVVKIPLFKQSEELRKYLDRIAIDVFKLSGLKHVMRMRKAIEDLSEKNLCIGELFLSHVRILLEEQHATCYEVLISLCSTRGELMINSRVTADVVSTIMTLCQPQYTNTLERFQEIIHQSDLWKIILKANGTSVQKVQEQKSYKDVILCLQKMSKAFHDADITYAFLDSNKMKKKCIIEMLTLVDDSKNAEITRHWNEIETYFESEIKKISCSLCVLTEMQKRKLTEYSSLNFKTTIENLGTLKKDILTGMINAGQLKKPPYFMAELGEITDKCVFLRQYVESGIFWNSCTLLVKTEFEKEWRTTPLEKTEQEAFESIPRLFGEDLDDENSDGSEVLEITMLLKILVEKGIAAYRQAWTSLDAQDKDLSFVLGLLSKVNVVEETNYAEKILLQPISLNLKQTLVRLHNITKYEYIVDTVLRSLNVFGVSTKSSKELHDAISTFENIKAQKTGCPFSDVIKSLEKVDSFSHELLNETVEILRTLSESSSLIEFLRKIVEEDIRNLIDAVEDISEQHVQESTVSALIEVKSFLHGVLINTPNDMNAQQFLEVLNKQTSNISTSASKMPAKIVECMDSLHNLISLYGNVANRGEMTAEIVVNIISRGKVKFELVYEGKCDFFATYRHSSVREKHSKHLLMDLRSRALLLMNTRKKTHERKVRSQELEDFVSYMDLCIEIGELIDNLNQSGEMDYITFSTFTDCAGLVSLQRDLYQRLGEWNMILSTLRKKFYLLNFIRGPEIHILYYCFEKKMDLKRVEVLLRFIHPDLKLDSVLKAYSSLRGEAKSLSNEEILCFLGKSLHSGYGGNLPKRRPFDSETHIKRLTQVVQNKRIYVAALEENSNQVIKTMLSLYMTTTQTLPEPYQVLFCTKDTAWNDLELLLCRCLASFEFSGEQQLYCIANVEMLNNAIQFQLVEKLKNIDTNANFLLSLICRGSGKHPFLDELSTNTNKSSVLLSDEQLRQVLQNECPAVTTYTSSVPGLGKSSKIKQKAYASCKSVVSLHLSGPVYRTDIIERLLSADLKSHHALHIDIGSVDNAIDLDTFVFELLILRYVSTKSKSYSLQTNVVYIEVANTIGDSLRNSLHTVMSFKREHLKWENYDDYTISMEVNSPVQVVCQYLESFEKGLIDRNDLHFSEKQFEKPLNPNHCKRLLRKYFHNDTDFSFTIVNTFVRVLADQLKKMSCSSFFRVSRLSEMTGQNSEISVRSTLLLALIEASKEFSCRSNKESRSAQIRTVGANALTQNATEAKSVEVNERTEGMIRWEDSNHLIYIFHSQNIQTISPMYRDLVMVPKHVRSLFESQMKRDMYDYKSLTQNELLQLLQKVARTNPFPLNYNTIKQLNDGYALTPDNVLKMVLIIIRVNSYIPVIIMGETGCGKTSLVRYLATVSEIDFEVMSIHAGVEGNKIVQIITQNNEKALSFPEKQRWLFLDEINTSEHIGIINDAVCHKRCLGKLLAPNLIVMGACNPYKLRTESAISVAGLKGKTETDELSKLVYRVLPLSESMMDYVWDFGTLSDADETTYIQRMVEGVFPSDENMLSLLKDLLSASQCFVRKLEAVSYSVSLRDVQRCKILVEWFLTILPIKYDICDDLNYKSVILALSICYHSRFSSNNHRCLYRQELQNVFRNHNRTKIDAETIMKTIIDEQKDTLMRMELPPGTAQNTALQENVFVVLVCLLNRIPIFLVGKPGCSKSLSMQIIRSNLRGKDSKNIFFKSLPQLYCVCFQGSESSTSDGIIKVFEKATKYQESNNVDEVLSVVILDEIGLAEISKFNPLKVLHSLLEPDGRPLPDVAVVGISNWSLDASKMNRGIHLSRPDMDVEELYRTGISISESFLESSRNDYQSHFVASHTPQKHVLEQKSKSVLKNIAESYMKYVNRLSFTNFHGLRDYYSLVKFISKRLLEDEFTLDDDKKKQIVLRGLQRNFGGLPAESGTLLNMFKIQVHDHDFGKTDVLEIMAENIKDPLARHLMCITSGDSVLSLVENLLTDIHRDEKVVIFGSHFEEDQTSDYNYRILSRIILCMEQGFVLILKDLENIYGSLYDMLNQNYTIIGKKKHCRVALGHYSNPICHVSDTFRCVVLVDENKVDYSDPPFLNRFEKQYLRFTDTVDKTQACIIRELDVWVKQFATADGSNFDEIDCFPIYSRDMIPSLVLKTCRTFGDNYSRKDIVENCKAQLLNIVQSDAVFRLEKNSYNEIRLEAKRIKEDFLKLPIHSGIWHYIGYYMKNSPKQKFGLLTIVLTNDSIHNTKTWQNTNMNVQVEKLGVFKSEKQLQLRIQYFWTEAVESILFLHCSAVEDEKHISHAKAIIENIRADAYRCQSTSEKHVYMIVHLDKRRAGSNMMLPINFLSGWELVTLDTIHEPETSLTELSTLSLRESVNRKKPLNSNISEQLFWSFSRIQYKPFGRELQSIQNVIHKMQESDELLGIIDDYICTCIDAEFKGWSNTEWTTNVALNACSINTNCSFLVALEQEVLNVIKMPMCKVIYQMENMNVLSCYFCDVGSTSLRKQSLKRMLLDTKFFTTADTHTETGPECYLCSAADLPLRMPFSKFIFETVEETRNDFMESYLIVKEKCDVEDDEQMPKQLLELLFSKHEGTIQTVMPDISEYIYDGLCEDYFHDFCHFISFAIPSKITQVRKSQIFQWLLERKMSLQSSSHLEQVVKLHATFWIFSSVLNAEYELLETCSEIFNNEENVYQFLSPLKIDIRAHSECTSTNTDSMHGNVQSVSEEIVSQYKGSSDAEITADVQNSFDNVSSVNDVPVSPSNVTNFNICADISGSALLEVRDITHSDEEEWRLNNTFSEGEYLLPNATDMKSYDSSNNIPSTVFINSERLEEHERLSCADTNLTAKRNEMPLVVHIQKTDQTATMTVNRGIDDKNNVTSTTYVGETLPLSKMQCPGAAVLDMHDTATNMNFTSSQENVQLDPRKDLVGFVSAKLMPTTTTLGIFKSFSLWERSACSVLAFSAKLSRDSIALYSLRFCFDLISVLDPHLQKIKLRTITQLGEMLSARQKLDSPACFHCVHSLIFDDPKIPPEEAKIVLCSYLNKCLAADVNSQALIYFLGVIKDKQIHVDSLEIFKSPLQVAFDEDEGIFCNLILTAEIDSNEYPFLCALDETLKGMRETEDVDSPFAVLIVDILQEQLSRLLPKLMSDTENLKAMLLSAQHVILDYSYGLRFLVAVSFYKSFTKDFATSLKECNYDISKCMLFLPVIKALVDNENTKSTLLSMRHYFIREIGKGMIASKLCQVCQTLSDTFEFLNSWHLTQEYNCQSVERNPLFLFAPTRVKLVEDICRQQDTAKQKEMFHELFSNTRYKMATLALHGVCLRWFYLARSYKEQNDTQNELAKVLLAMAEEEKIDSANVNMLAFILGHYTFQELDLNDGSDGTHVAVSMFCTTLIAVLLPSSQKIYGEKNLSLLAKLILCPSEVDPDLISILMHACKRKTDRIFIFKEMDNYGVTCKCGARIYAKIPLVFQQLQCPVCSQDLSTLQFITENSHSLGESVQLEGRAHTSVEYETVITIVHLCVYTCLLGSLTLKLSDQSDIEKITGISEVDDISATVMSYLISDFEHLEGLLNMNTRDVYVFLQTCLMNLNDFISNEKCLFSTAEDIHKWTNRFGSYIKAVLKTRHESTIQFVKKYRGDMDNKCETLDLCVNENDNSYLEDGKRIMYLPSLFRVQGKATFSSFKLALQVLGDTESHPYPFLLFVLDVLPELSVTEHLLNLVRWHIATVMQVGTRMKRRPCLEMTVEEFIHNDKNEGLRKRLKDTFQKLKASLAFLADISQDFKVLCQGMTSQTKMKDCLILDSTSCLHQLIVALVDIHNKFLDKTLQISVEKTCKALQFLSKRNGVSAIPGTRLSEIKLSSLVNFHWDDELLELFSHADLRYGYGSDIKYEFESIEKVLAIKIVVGKSYIVLDNGLPSVIFVDEFYKGYGQMAKDMEKVIPQVPLSADIQLGIQRKRKKHPRLTAELITHVGVLISMAKKTKGDPQMPLTEYVETWRNILTSPLPSELLPSPEDSVKLCHLIALYGLLEELNADSLMDSLDDAYKCQLDFDIQTQLNRLLQTKKQSVVTLLKATKRFTYRCLSSGEIDKAQPLLEYLTDVSFWPFENASGTAQSDDECRETQVPCIPVDLKVQHVYEMVVFLEDRLKELSDQDVELSLISNRFVPQGDTPRAEKKQRRARKRIV